MPIDTKRILVTGADGFVGRAVCAELDRVGYVVRRSVRVARAGMPPSTVAVGDVGPETNWSSAVHSVDTVVHLVGRAHFVGQSTDPEAARRAYFAVNADGTEKLARDAVLAGVRRIVFVSSIKVNGEATTVAPYSETDQPRPEDDYGRSKWDAEQRLADVARGSNLEYVIVRPPLVYGAGVKGNLARLMRLVDRGIPLPLGGIDNRRSLVGLTNLAQALVSCVSHPAASGETFLVSDDQDLSTSQLIHALARALNRPARLVPVPGAIIAALARVTGSGMLRRLSGSLCVDSGRIRTKLGWLPTTSVDAEMEFMAAAYRRTMK